MWPVFDLVSKVKAFLGIANPTTADRTTIMNFLKQIADSQIGSGNPSTADRTKLMNFLQLIYNSTKNWQSDVFLSSGTWTAPAGVTKVFITACAGGGGSNLPTGPSTYTTAGTGGVTSFGALISLSGGTGATSANVPGKGGGQLGCDGGGPISIGSSYGSGVGGTGGGSIFCSGSPGTQPNTTNRTTSNAARGTGGGGSGVTTSPYAYSAGGGGGAGLIKYPLYDIVPGTAYTITVGSGGSGTAQEGGAGMMIIEYNA